MQIPTAVRSSLPVDDPEIGAIVREFVEKLSCQIEQMEAASTIISYAELASLAHWLKGAGGTVGFDCFTEPGPPIGTVRERRQRCRNRWNTPAIAILAKGGSGVVMELHSSRTDRGVLLD